MNDFDKPIPQEQPPGYVAPAVPCLKCGKDMHTTHADELFCSDECATLFHQEPWVLQDYGKWSPWANRQCVCGSLFNARYALQTACCDEHLDLRRCQCGQTFKFEGDNRITKCPACRSPAAKDYPPTPCAAGCGRMFKPTDGRTKYCPTCSTLPFHLRKGRAKTCPTCGKLFVQEHGLAQMHCQKSCAWPAIWDITEER
jgi:hypothetical protein